MISKEMGGKKKDAEREGEEEDWGNVYRDLVKVVTRASKDVRI